MKKILKTLPLFEHLDDAMINALLDSNDLVKKRYQKHSVIHIPKDTVDAYEIILSGTVSIKYLESSGHVVTINWVNPYDVIGANLLFSSNRQYEMIVESLSEVMLLSIRREKLIELAQSNRNFMIALLKQVSDRSNLLAKRLKSFATSSLYQKVLDYLTSEYQYQKNNPLKLQKTKQAIAMELGVARTSLVRILTKMREEGMLTFNRKEILLQKSFFEIAELDD